MAKIKKDAYYFSHDSNARNDEKILALRMKWDWKGYGLFWAIIEKLRENASYACVKDYNIIAFDLRTDAALIKSIVEDFGLFAFTEDGKCLYSERLNDSMEAKEISKEKLSSAGKKGAEARYSDKLPDSHPIATLKPPYSHPIATLKPPYSHPIASKGKESKGNVVEENKEATAAAADFEFKKIQAFTELFARASKWDEQMIDHEVRKFINKYPKNEPSKSGNLINSWVANYKNPASDIPNNETPEQEYMRKLLKAL